MFTFTDLITICCTYTLQHSYKSHTKYELETTLSNTYSVNTKNQHAIIIIHCEAQKLHPCLVCNNLIKLRSSMPIFASS